jgi:hypothetical protein
MAKVRLYKPTDEVGFRNFGPENTEKGQQSEKPEDVNLSIQRSRHCSYTLMDGERGLGIRTELQACCKTRGHKTNRQAK